MPTSNPLTWPWNTKVTLSLSLISISAILLTLIQTARKAPPKPTRKKPPAPRCRTPITPPNSLIIPTLDLDLDLHLHPDPDPKSVFRFVDLPTEIRLLVYEQFLRRGHFDVECKGGRLIRNGFLDHRTLVLAGDKGGKARERCLVCKQVETWRQGGKAGCLRCNRHGSGLKGDVVALLLTCRRM